MSEARRRNLPGPSTKKPKHGRGSLGLPSEQDIKYAYAYTARKRQREQVNFPISSRDSLSKVSASSSGPVATNLPAFQLLCKIHLPRYQNIVTESRLIELLPVLVRPVRSASSIAHTDARDATGTSQGTYTMLNYQIHLFLATVTSKFIDSWYSSKLNTDDLEFLQHVYRTLCLVVHKLIERYQTAVIGDADSAMRFTNELVDILNEHISDLRSDAYTDAYSHCNVLVGDDADLQPEYLRLHHVIFSNLGANLQHTDDTDDTDDDAFQAANESFIPPQEYVPSTEVVYFRVISANILAQLFDTADGVEPLTPISEGLVVSILGDLVFVKLVESFARPGFLLGLVNLILEKLEQPSGAASSAGANATFKQQVAEYLHRAYAAGASVVRTVSGVNRQPFAASADKPSPDVPTSTVLHQTYPFMDSAVFGLLDTLVQFSTRTPLLCGILQQARAVLSMNSTISSFVDHRVKSYIGQKIASMPFVADTFLADLTSSLRHNLFPSENEKQTPELPKKENVFAVPELSQRIYLWANTKVPTMVNDTNKHDFVDAANAILRVFENEQLNKLLIVKWLDLVVLSLFPELAATEQ